MTHTPSHILITGGAGFIGANFIHHLATQRPHCRLINLDALTYAGSQAHLNTLIHPNYHFVKGNITDRSLVDTLLKQFDIDTIVHFAAESHVDRSIEYPQDFIQTNLVGTFTLLEAARQHFLTRSQRSNRFHHISTDEVFGSLTEEAALTTEEDPYRPNSPYSASKAGSDHLVRAYYHTYQLPCTLTYCSNNYGPFQHQEKFIPTIIRACLAKQPIPIYGEGKNKRDWLYVRDHCSGILSILEKGQLGESYNIGSNNEWSNLELVKHICSLMDNMTPQSFLHQTLITFVTDRLGHDWRYGLNTEKIQTLGWKPQVSFDDGLERTIRYFMQLQNSQ
ncbi:MAG: dTDP-glucose 4,6-dehydratase [Gammaproteobacteria bacterium]|nr:dTDP-glucose 4,6-dehydratase [Gammaproteobacteria bacterium]